MLPTAEQDAAQILIQEKTLTLPEFTAETAWVLGTMLRAKAIERKQTLVIDIRRFGRPVQPLFYTALPGTTGDHARWVRRKSNTVARWQRSSYAVGIKMDGLGQTIAERYALPASEYATDGGSFPISVPSAGGVIGAITISGLTSREDHELAVEVLCEHLGLAYDGLKLT